MARPLSTGAAASESTRSRGPILVAAVSGVLSAVLIFAYLSSKDGSGSSSPRMRSAKTWKNSPQNNIAVLKRKAGLNNSLKLDLACACCAVTKARVSRRYLAISRKYGMLSRLIKNA